MRERAGCGGATEAGTDSSRCPGEEAMGLGGELGQRRWDLGEMAFRDDDWYLGAEGLRVGEEWETHHRRTEHAKCITTRQRRSSTHTPTPLTSPIHEAIAKKRKKEPACDLYKYTSIHPPPPPWSPSQPPPQLIPKHKHAIRRQRRQRHGDRLAPLERARDRRPAQHHRRQQRELDAERLGVLDAQAAEGVYLFSFQH